MGFRQAAGFPRAGWRGEAGARWAATGGHDGGRAVSVEKMGLALTALLIFGIKKGALALRPPGAPALPPHWPKLPGQSRQESIHEQGKARPGRWLPLLAHVQWLRQHTAHWFGFSQSEPGECLLGCVLEGRGRGRLGGWGSLQATGSFGQGPCRESRTAALGQMETQEPWQHRKPGAHASLWGVAIARCRHRGRELGCACSRSPRWGSPYPFQKLRVR